MGECKLDHSQEDVRSKLSAQQEHLPHDLYLALAGWLSRPQPQPALNEVFHLLKKYDLAAEAEQAERNKKLLMMLNGRA
ncbi:MAG: group-specific protein [Brevibacillus sp.]|nr:group-specific protein [Brevibacillus sp.]